MLTEKYDKLTVYNKEIRSIISELDLFFNKYHGELFEVYDTDPTYPYHIKTYTNDANAVILYIGYIVDNYNTSYQISIGDMKLLTMIY